jgi:hypothetical protein
MSNNIRKRIIRGLREDWTDAWSQKDNPHVRGEMAAWGISSSYVFYLNLL